MIKSLKIKNWKSFEDSVLYIDPLTFVIGTNASGKSNLLDAFQLLQRLSSGLSLSVAINGDNMNILPLRGGAEWAIRSGSVKCSLEVVIQSGKKDYTYTIGFQKSDSTLEIVEEKLKSEDTELFSIDDTSKGTLPEEQINRTYSVLFQIERLNVLPLTKEISKKIIKTLQDIFILDPIPNHMRNYAQLSEKLTPDAKNIAGVLAALDDKEREEVEHQLTEYLRPLPEKDINRVFVEKIGRFKSDAMLYCEEKWTEDKFFEVDARGMSDGTLRFLAIITAILLGKKNNLLIIEEVDNGLHPSRAKDLVLVLKELSALKQIDILCTTHNPTLINSLGNEMIPFISCVKRNNETGCSEIELLEDISNLPKYMATSSIGDLMVKNLV